jgi:hypothetical protein
VPPKKREPPARDRRLSGETVEVAGVDVEDHSLSIPTSRLLPRAVRSDELGEFRAIFWRQVALGHRLPAELSVIVLKGGRV